MEKDKSEYIRRLPVHDFLQVCFVSQTSRTNKRLVVIRFKFGYSHLTLKRGFKVKSK